MKPEVGKLLLHKADINDKVADLYRKVADSPGSSFDSTQLRAMGIQLIPWSTKNPKGGHPKFFQPFPSKALQSFDIPEFSVHSMFNPDDYPRTLHMYLTSCLFETWNENKDEHLVGAAGWELTE